MTVADLSRRIRLGEDSTLELKRVVLSAKWLPSFWRGSFKSAVRAA